MTDNEDYPAVTGGWSNTAEEDYAIVTRHADPLRHTKRILKFPGYAPVITDYSNHTEILPCA